MTVTITGSPISEDLESHTDQSGIELTMKTGMTQTLLPPLSEQCERYLMWYSLCSWAHFNGHLKHNKISLSALISTFLSPIPLL